MAAAELSLECLGPRTAELEWLRFSDLTSGYLRIRETDERGLKTPSSPRILPLLLLPPDFREKVEGFLEVRAQRLAGNRYLLASEDDSGPIKHSIVHEPLIEVISELTDNPEARMYHFRHSFASWLALGLAYSTLSLDSLRGRVGELDEVLDMGNVYASELVCPRRTSNVLFEIAILLGHSGPHVGCRHYIHVMDLILLGVCESRIFPDDAELLLAILEVPRTTKHRNRAKPAVDLVRLAEKRRKGWITREDRPRKNAPAAHLLEIIDQVAQLIRDPVTGPECPGIALADIEMIKANLKCMAEMRSSKNGSEALRHQFETTNDGVFPQNLDDNFDLRGAVRCAAYMQQAILGLPYEQLAWGCKQFEEHMQRSDPRVSFSSLQDAQRFAEILNRGGVPRKAIRWGIDSTPYITDIQRYAGQANANYFVSIVPGFVPQVSSQGARWVWQIVAAGLNPIRRALLLKLEGAKG